MTDGSWCIRRERTRGGGVAGVVVQEETGRWMWTWTLALPADADVASAWQKSRPLSDAQAGAGEVWELLVRFEDLPIHFCRTFR